METQIRPRGGLVLLKQHESSEKTTAKGIIIPLAVVDAGVTYATVLAVGPGAVLDNGQRSPMDLEVGDTVIFQSARAMPVTLAGDKVFLVDQGHITAVVIGDDIRNETLPKINR